MVNFKRKKQIEKQRLEEKKNRNYDWKKKNTKRSFKGTWQRKKRRTWKVKNYWNKIKFKTKHRDSERTKKFDKAPTVFYPISVTCH